MHVVAAIELEPAAAAQSAGDQSFKADSLKAAGITLLRLNPKALPRREDLRGLVCGGNPATGAGTGIPAKSG